MATSNKGVCRSCGQPFLWLLTAKGNRMPVNPEPDDSGNIVVEEGKCRMATEDDRQGNAVLYKSHFATCPGAANHRQSKEKSNVDQ